MDNQVKTDDLSAEQVLRSLESELLDMKEREPEKYLALLKNLGQALKDVMNDNKTEESPTT